jgi:23S rRNA pseudouridine1911/1915/1917 synthase
VADPSELTVPDALGGSRVDKAVAELLGVSRAVARHLVDEGVTIDGVPADPSDRVSARSVLRVPPLEEKPVLAPEAVDFDVVYEDEDLIVVDKPPGLVVHPGGGRLSGTLAGGLLHRYPELMGVGQEGRWGVVHRLDKDTSGLLLVARNEESHRRLTASLRRREITRMYTTLVHGVLDSATGTIDAPIGRDPAQPMRRALIAEGKPARTHYEVTATFPEADCSLLSVRLETGRTHQIRVHFAAIDHPVVGDPSYGRRPRRTTSPRMFLHASELRLAHPRTDVPVVVSSPLPEDLQNVLDRLR